MAGRYRTATRKWRAACGPFDINRYSPRDFMTLHLWIQLKAKFRLQGQDDSVRATTGRKVLREPAGMPGIQYDSGESLAIGSLE